MAAQRQKRKNIDHFRLASDGDIDGVYREVGQLIQFHGIDRMIRL